MRPYLESLSQGGGSIIFQAVATSYEHSQDHWLVGSLGLSLTLEKSFGQDLGER